MKHLLILAALAVAGCSSLTKDVKQEMDPNTRYRRDMVVTANGKNFEGVGVVDPLPVNSFKVTARGDLNLFVRETCAGVITKESAWDVQPEESRGFFDSLFGSRKVEGGRTVTFQYSPEKGLEDGLACPLILAGYDKGGRHSQAFVDFKNPALFQISGRLGCNGKFRAFEGVDVCESKKGLYQVIEFDEAVMVSPDRGCEIGQPKGNRFEFPVNRGDCVYIFKGVGNDRLARITMSGYDEIAVREK